MPIHKGGDGVRLGRLVLVRHRRSDTYCGVTTRRWHRKRWTMVELRKTKAGGVCSLPPGPTGCRTKRDPRRGHPEKYRKFAGPLYLERNGGCIMISGTIGGAGLPIGTQTGNCF